MHIVTGCLHPTTTNYMPILAGIQPAEFCQQGAFSLAYYSLMNSKHLLHQLMAGLITTQERGYDLGTPLHLHTGAGRFQPPMPKWGLAATSICECDELDQTASHLILKCPLHCDLEDIINCWS